jgi:hypothetical protein
VSVVSGAERAMHHYYRHQQRVKARWRAWSMTPHGTITVLLNYAKDRARRAELPFDLDREWLAPKLSAGICEVSGLLLERVSPGQYRTHPYAPSIDRVTPSDGYVKNNCRLVCFAVNRARSDFGDDVLLTIASGIVKHLTR